MVWAVARTEKGTRFMVRVLTISIITAGFLAVTLGRRDSTGRLAGGYAYDPNDIALLAVTGIPLVIWWALDKRNKYGMAILLSLPLLFQVIIKSQSRGGFLGLLAMTFGFILVGLGPVEKKVKRIALIAGLGIIMAIPFFPASYLKQMKTITDDSDYNRTSITGRKEIWKRGFSYALGRPLFGVGLGNFNSAEGRSDASLERSESGKGFKWGTAHNSYVQVMAELGFIGGACFVVLIFGSIITLITLHRRGGHSDMLPPMFALAMTGFAASAFFLSWGYYDLPYVMAAIACAILMRAQAGSSAPSAVPAPVIANGRVRR
jgi:O-antigen ligase